MEKSNRGDLTSPNSRWQWDVQLLLPDAENWFTVCTAVTPYALAEIIRCLTGNWGDDQRNITIKARAS